MGWKPAVIHPGDIRTALRRLRRRPGYAAAAVVLLGMGIGAMATVFALVEAALLRAPPFPEPDRLVLVWQSDASSGRIPLAAPDAAELERAAAFQEVGAILRTDDAALERAGEVTAVRTNLVTPSLFALLGARPAAGRLIRPEEAFAADPGNPPPAPVLLSHGFWRSAFAADAGIVGRALRLDGRPVTVVGVLPEGYRVPLPPESGVSPAADVWVPLPVPLSALERASGLRDQDTDNRGVTLARLANGATAASAMRELDVLTSSRRVPPSGEASGLRVVPLLEDATATARPTLLILLGAVGLVLLLTCASVAALLLARAQERGRELAVRAALGAARWRLVGPLVAEGAVLGLAAGAAGLLIASWATPALAHVAPASLSLPHDLGFDARVLAFGAVTTLAATLLATVLPALRPRQREEVLALRASGFAGAARASLRSRRALVVTELALSVTLLVGAGLLARTVSALQAVEPGFDPRGVAAFDLALIYPDRYRGPADRAGFVRALEARLHGLPGVTAVGVIGGAPLDGERFTQPWGDPEEPPERWTAEADFRVISEGYFDALGTALLRGRAFRPEDDRQDRRVVIVDRALAERVAPGGRAVGHRIGVPMDGQAVSAEIVGVVEPVRFDDLRSQGRPAIYVPYRHEASRRITVAVRTSGTPAALGAPIRRELAALDPRLPAFDFRSMAAHVREATAGARFALLLMIGFAGTATLIAAVGLYALVAHGVTSRIGELGLRMALGADAPAVMRLVLGEALALVVPGLALGGAAAVVLTRLMRSILYGVSPGDPTTYGAVSILLLATAGLAVLLPARRAAAVDPAEALRRGA